MPNVCYSIKARVDKKTSDTTGLCPPQMLAC